MRIQKEGSVETGGGGSPKREKAALECSAPGKKPRPTVRFVPEQAGTNMDPPAWGTRGCGVLNSP